MSDRETTLALIKNLSFFAGFSQPQKEYLANLKSNIFHSKPGEYIVRQGDYDRALYILIKGRVNIFKNERPKMTLANLKPGSIFGEISFLKSTPRLANAVADTNTIYLKIDGKLFEEMNPLIQNELRAKILDVFVERLDDLNRRYIRDAVPDDQRSQHRRVQDRESNPPPSPPVPHDRRKEERRQLESCK